ncbi:MAG: response regulator transcription factor [Henriciella sp.]|uniref:response regulator transcription factor n=1 Tax=Henriciella sp. TaxID=1968823 RepID=UPI0032EFA0AB
MLVEDDENLAARLTRGLQQAGFVVEHASDGPDGYEMGLDASYDAIILDLGLPGEDGLSVLSKWRTGGLSTPILILTARGTWAEKVEGLNLGADDYLTKPFHLPELTARLNALLRRGAGAATALLSHNGLTLNPSTGEVHLDGALVELTALEFRMLRYLMHRPRHVVSQSELTEHLYSLDDMRGSNTIEVYISRLRRKIGVDRIKTVRGLGYRFG